MTTNANGHPLAPEMLPANDRAHTHEQIVELDQSISQLEARELKLATELRDLHSELFAKCQQRATLRSRLAPVWSLPTELLAYIFELGVLEDHALVSADEEDEDDDFHIIEFQVLVSHVCRMFRQVAIRSANLWAQIYIYDLESPRLDFLKTCLQRSGASHLDITLQTERLYRGDEKVLDNLAAMLVPHISRLKHLRVRLRGFSSLHPLMRRLDQPAPLLETLELSDIDYVTEFDEEELFPIPHMRKPLTLFQGMMPKLCLVTLDGAHVDWTSCNFKNLVAVKLGYHARDVRPTYDEFKAIIQASPCLESLDLMGSAPFIQDDSAEPVHYQPISMEKLLNLRIADIPSDYVTTLISLIHAANLKFLALTDMDTNDYSTLVRKIAGPPVMFPELTALKLATIEVDDAACGDLLRAYPALTYLSLHYSGEMSTMWLEVLEPRGEDPEVVCPKLERLRCVGVSALDVHHLLKCRQDAGFKIPCLELDQDTVDEAPLGCMEWFRDHTKMEVIVPSEHGSDDDSDPSGWGTDDDYYDESDDDIHGLPFFSMGGFMSDIDYEPDYEEYDDESESEVGMDGTEDTGSEGTDGTDNSNEPPA